MKLNIISYLKNLLSNQRTTILYLEVHDQILLIATGTINDTLLTLTAIESIPLSTSEVVHGIIFNPHMIVHHITATIKKQKRGNPTAILCVPALMQKPEHLHPFLTLQYALCIARSPARLTHLIAEPLIDAPAATTQAPITIARSKVINQLNFISLLNDAKQASPFAWLLASSTLLIALGCTSFYTTILLTKTLHKKKAATKQLVLHKNQLQKQADTLKSQKLQVKHHETELQKIHQFKKQVTYPAPLLLMFAQTIAPEAFLTSIKLTTSKSKTDKKQQTKKIAIEGISYKTHAVSSFIKNLQASGQATQLVLAKLSKEENKRAKVKKHYRFKLHGILP